MKIQVFSDLHLEFDTEFLKLEPVCDYLILAGDIGILHETCFKEFMDYVSNHWKHIFYIMGNHEYYKHKDMNKVLAAYKTFFGNYSNITLLQNEKIALYDDETDETWSIMGSTLWGIYPADAPHDYTSSLRRIYKKQEITQNDRIIIRTNLITREIFNQLYETDKTWILENYNPGENTILITHFPVKIVGTSHPMWDDEKYKTIFATDLYVELENKRNDKRNKRLMETPEEKHGKLICIAGHTHYSHHFIENNITYISNQQGLKNENNEGITEFNWNGIYEI